LLIQRPIDAYCNRFVVGRCHFSLASERAKEKNRIKEKKKAERNAMNGQ